MRTNQQSLTLDSKLLTINFQLYPIDSSTIDVLQSLLMQTLLDFKGQAGFPKEIGEFWTAQQRQMHSLHYAVSYRASFKPELPDYFIRRYSRPGDVVFDPFGGRGTTVLQANLLGRIGYSNDVNPLSERIAYPKTHPVSLKEVQDVLSAVPFDHDIPLDQDLSMFYHERTHREILNLMEYLREHRSDADRFLEMIALSRLHGHSAGFFSVYSFPQISVPKTNQIRINRRRSQVSDYRPIAPRIIKKARKVIADADVSAIRDISKHNRFFTHDARDMVSVPSGCASLIVTSPPFLNKADYITDNWLEFWFLGIDIDDIRRKVVQTANLEEWRDFIRESMREMRRVLAPDGVCVIEVGDVLHCREPLNLDDVITDLAAPAGLAVEKVMIHQQRFTKLANTFNVDNNEDGTNTHRLVIMRGRV